MTRRRSLHDPTIERDACGIGFVARSDGTSDREVVELLLDGLCRVRHRGATSADGKTGDGAGLLFPIPRSLVPSPDAGLAMVFIRDEASRGAIETACRDEGIEPLGWRVVPTDDAALGNEARESAPKIEQLVLARPAGADDQEAEWAAYRARRRAERLGGAYIASLSFRLVTYKALCAADQLGHFYTDLTDPKLTAPHGVFHQRFSTNTTPSWERAQPFRMLCHNGEINAIQGNVNWMRAREGNFGSQDDELYHPVLDESGSDSAMLDNALEFLVHGSRDVRHAAEMLIPPAWERDEELEPAVRSFFRFHASLIEPWDGPAGVVFTDGRTVGASLDRNGLRPLRLSIADDGFVACTSEAGSVPLVGHGAIRRLKLGPGQIVAIDPERGVQLDADVKRDLARRAPYGRWLEEGLVEGSAGEPVEAPDRDLTPEQVLYGYTREELTMFLRPIAGQGHDPTYSMGDDTALPPLAGRSRPLYHYFKQRFAQVTNPPIDHLRERFAMSTRVVLGSRAPLFSDGADVAGGIELDSFFLFPSALSELSPIRLDGTLHQHESLRSACTRLGNEAERAIAAGAGLLLVSDVAIDRAPIPALLATGVVHQRLVARGLRTKATLIVETSEAREVHHFACLLGYGAEAIAPRLALETIADLASKDKVGGDRPTPEEAQLRFKEVIEDGVLKIMAKMGISDVASYTGAQIFDVIGLATEVTDAAFTGTPCPIGGVGFDELDREIRERMTSAAAGKPKLENPGYYKWRKGGEPHATSGEVVDALHELHELNEAHALNRAVKNADGIEITENGWHAYEQFAALVASRPPLQPRDLLETIVAGPPVPIDEVEPAKSIVRRFSSGAMSHGALSAEAHETIAIALNRLGAKANTGEGGEDPGRYRDERNSPIKQIASGRFGVTPEYAAWASELQIKMAQGSKPGEGGQLPGHKVSEEIARLRHTVPGVALISPPPHHDIYSIEDLAQLIFDLRQVNPRADISVKLVAESGVGLVAAGCVKALANVVHISGADGGTGASPLTSIKNAGSPWELGLAETQQALVSNGLRGRVRVRTDGGFKTGRDVIVAALLGADEVSFGTALLLAEGCLMVRSCHVDTCPVGIATQRPELREKYAGTPEMVMQYLVYVAEDVRRQLARLGLRSYEEAVGRVDLLRQRVTHTPRADVLDLDPLLTAPESGPTRFVGDRHIDEMGHRLGDQLALDAAAILDDESEISLSYAIENTERTVGARLGGKIGKRYGAGNPPGTVRAAFAGSAGQSFGAFLAAGIELTLTGEANDYVGKGMSGGRIVVRAPADDAGEPTLLGNTVLYGATGGELYCAGAAGERFCVRNSGATTVIEGTGDHPCEYMTGGTVVVLGPYGFNLGAGMTGGQVYLFDPEERLEKHLNPQLVAAHRLSDDDATLRPLIELHRELTGSIVAAELLERWNVAIEQFWRIAPKEEVARIESAAEGTLAKG